VAFAAALAGLVAIVIWRFVRPEYFTGGSLRQDVAVTETGGIVPIDELPGEATA